MAFERIVEAMIKETMDRGEFENLPVKGRDDLARARSAQGNCGAGREKRQKIAKQIQQKRVEFSRMMQRRQK
jgi:hypothetical protein